MGLTMLEISIRFYEELNDFLKSDLRKTEIRKTLNHRTTVKDVIESFMVPHTEVDLILVNGVSVDFSHRIDDGDQISVYPVFESFDISAVTSLQQRPLRDLRFIADCHLGTLTRRLRILGLDVEFRNDITDDELVDSVVNAKRILLTRDRRLLMRKVVDRGYLVRSQNPEEQVDEIIKRFDLRRNLRPFTRCAACNGILEPVEKAEILHLLEPKTKLYFENFYQCQTCQKVYWRGSHFEKLETFVKKHFP
jgi:uncharacterized protein with PIN domain